VTYLRRDPVGPSGNPDEAEVDSIVILQAANPQE
jgi:hypothetical protein